MKQRTGWILRAGEQLLLVVAAVLLGTYAHARLQAWAFREREGVRLVTLLGKGPSNEALSPAGPVSTLRENVVPGRAWGRLEMPRLGLSALVAEGDDPRTLGVAVGHIRGTAFPGESGNVGLAGHRDTVFLGLKEARRDDLVRLSTPDGVFEYRITRLSIVRPSQIDVLEPGPAPVLTLVTCYPFAFVGRAPMRFVVRAALTTSPGGMATEAEAVH